MHLCLFLYIIRNQTNIASRSFISSYRHSLTSHFHCELKGMRFGVVLVFISKDDQAGVVIVVTHGYVKKAEFTLYAC